jgi:hypothetical protein
METGSVRSRVELGDIIGLLHAACLVMSAAGP